MPPGSNKHGNQSIQSSWFLQAQPPESLSSAGSFFSRNPTTTKALRTFVVVLPKYKLQVLRYPRAKAGVFIEEIELLHHSLSPEMCPNLRSVQEKNL